MSVLRAWWRGDDAASCDVDAATRDVEAGRAPEHARDAPASESARGGAAAQNGGTRAMNGGAPTRQFTDQSGGRRLSRRGSWRGLIASRARDWLGGGDAEPPTPVEANRNFSHDDESFRIWDVLAGAVTKLHGAFKVHVLYAQRKAGVFLNICRG